MSPKTTATQYQTRLVRAPIPDCATIAAINAKTPIGVNPEERLQYHHRVTDDAQTVYDEFERGRNLTRARASKTANTTVGILPWPSIPADSREWPSSVFPWTFEIHVDLGFGQFGLQIRISTVVITHIESTGLARLIGSNTDGIFGSGSISVYDPIGDVGAFFFGEVSGYLEPPVAAGRHIWRASMFPSSFQSIS